MRIDTEPRSDQWNADDFVDGSRMFTVEKVTVGSAEQKYDVHLVEGQGRVWRPPVTVLRLLKAGWGNDGSVWPGHRVILYRDPTIKFGRDVLGGIRVSHASHIDAPIVEKLTSTRGKREQYTIDVLTDEMQIDTLRVEWKTADPERRQVIEAEVARLLNPDATPAQAADEGTGDGS